jgi:hypothetical protein
VQGDIPVPEVQIRGLWAWGVRVVSCAAGAGVEGEMIYAIRAVGTEYVKFGRAASVGKRMKELETGCPFELHIEAVASWPDGQEKAIHSYLAEHNKKYEWFRDSAKTAQVIEWMNSGDAGLREFRVAFLAHAKSNPPRGLPKWLATEYSYPSQERKIREVRLTMPRVDQEPQIPIMPSDPAKVNDRYEQIKRAALERRARKTVQRSAETA